MKKNENKGSITKNSSLSWKGYLIATLSFLLLGGILTLLCWYSGGWSTSLWAAQIVLYIVAILIFAEGAKKGILHFVTGLKGTVVVVVVFLILGCIALAGYGVISSKYWNNLATLLGIVLILAAAILGLHAFCIILREIRKKYKSKEKKLV